ncbi:MAG TPA: hypothetical protein VHD31_02720 [Candidatus Paceibacterota bacterium]|nr:hypothetical protein [Candidatus Paceibacterota bacterium]
MTELLNIIATHPVQDVEVLLSFLGGFSVIIFLRGFLSGLPQLILINMDAEHLAHARTRAMWGMMLLWALFGIWELFRYTLALLFGETLPHSQGVLAVIIFVFIVFFALPYYLMPKGGGH